MKSYFFLFHLIAALNTLLLVVYCIYSFWFIKYRKKNIFKIVAFYLIFSFLFDLLTRITTFFFVPNILSDSLFLGILYRLGELLIVGYLINYYWLKYKFVWALIGFSALYMVYELFTYKTNGVFNYVAYAKIVSNLLLCAMLAANLIKQLKTSIKFSVSQQILNMVFLSYFCIHLIYTVVQNFILNQTFSDNSFVLFFCSYAILHILYYFSLAFVMFKKAKFLRSKKTN